MLSLRDASLHTLKGNFACFGLESIAHVIHHIEDAAEIQVTDVKRIENLARGLFG